MTSLRPALVFAVFSVAACSDETTTAPTAVDAAVQEAAVDAASDARTCTGETGARMCTTEDSALGGNFNRTWSGCDDGKEYNLTCGALGADGQRDCTCKANGAAIGSFRSVTPDPGQAGGSDWPNLFACYCGVRP